MNATVRLASTHLDLTATLLDLAGIPPPTLPAPSNTTRQIDKQQAAAAPPPPPPSSSYSSSLELDGLSFAAALAPGFTPLEQVAWRAFAFTENFGSGGVGGSDTWAALRFPNLLPSLFRGGDDDDDDEDDDDDSGWGPAEGHAKERADAERGATAGPAAAAAAAGLRRSSSRFLFGGGAKSHLWCTNQTEVFFLRKDPWELANEAASSPRGRLAAALTRPWLLRMASCAGAASCNAAPSVPGAWDDGGGEAEAAQALAELPCYWPVDPATGLPPTGAFDRFDP
jgi:hypothetical protein